MYLSNKVLVIDNFYKDPDKIRDFAIKQEFKPCTDPEMGGSWPGLRTRYLNNLNEDICREFKDNLIGNLLEGVATQYNCYFETNFQLCYESVKDSWIHTDVSPWEITHVGVIYLNPDPPADSGTNMYELRPEYTDEFKSYAAKHNNVWTTLNRDEDSEEFNRWFKLNMAIPNKFNRAVLYSPRAWHKADKYFGNSPESGRLTQVFFAKIDYS